MFKTPFEYGSIINIPNGYTGKVLLYEYDDLDDPLIWVDPSPGALCNYTWVYGHFSKSWEPTKPAIHAINKFRLNELMKYNDNTNVVLDS